MICEREGHENAVSKFINNVITFLNSGKSSLQGAQLAEFLAFAEERLAAVNRTARVRVVDEVVDTTTEDDGELFDQDCRQ